jgi:acetoacetate decarboxylase
MKMSDILTLPSVPLTSPLYPRGPFRFINREYLIITYESDPEAIRAALPDPLEPVESPLVLYEFINMPDSSGFGSYAESGVVIPARFEGEAINFTAQMYLNNEPAIAAGREIWGFPKKYGQPSLGTLGDTLTGILEYSGVRVAVGTMTYKPTNMLQDINAPTDAIVAKLSKTQVNLKLIPHADGTLAIAQLVGYRLTDICLKGAWTGPARLELSAHVNAPVADLPVHRVLGGLHLVADLTLPYGTVLHDYLK